MPPSIYMDCICDHMGISPTPLQWQVLSRHMIAYVSGGAEGGALKGTVDQLICPSPKRPSSLAKRDLR